MLTSEYPSFPFWSGEIFLCGKNEVKREGCVMITLCRYYDGDNDDYLERCEVEAMVRDIESIHARDTSNNTIQEKTREAFEYVVTLHMSPD